MLDIASGAVRAYYLFDVADTIDLAKASTLGADTRAPAALPLRLHAPPYLQFPVPPLVANLPEADFDGLRCSVRLKLYDYGVVSLRLSFLAGNTWNDLMAIAERARSDERIVRFAESTAERICDQYARALDERHAALIEDYLIVEIDRFDEPVDAESLLTITPPHSRACCSASASGCRQVRRRKRCGCVFPITRTT